MIQLFEKQSDSLFKQYVFNSASDLVQHLKSQYKEGNGFVCALESGNVFVIRDDMKLHFDVSSNFDPIFVF
jgi:hypothetical protein